MQQDLMEGRKRDSYGRADGLCVLFCVCLAFRIAFCYYARRNASVEGMGCTEARYLAISCTVIGVATLRGWHLVESMAELIQGTAQLGRPRSPPEALVHHLSKWVCLVPE